MSPSDLKLPPAAQSDKDLAALGAQGHEQAFSTLVARHSPALLAFARSTAGPELAEDVLQQSLMQAWSALRRGAEVQHVRGWLFQIVRRESWAASQGRVCSELPLTLASSDDVHASIEQRLQLERVVEHVGNLPKHQRLALVQTAMEGKSCAEVAATLGITEGAVRQLLHRGRERIRQAAAGFVPTPLWNWLSRAGQPQSAADSAGESVAAFALFGGAAKALVVLLGAGAVATGSAATIHDRLQATDRHATAPPATDSAPSSTSRLLSQLFAVPAGRSGSSPNGTFTAGVLAATPGSLPSAAVGGEPLPGVSPPLGSSRGGETGPAGPAPPLGGPQPASGPAGAGPAVGDGRPPSGSSDHQAGGGEPQASAGATPAEGGSESAAADHSAGAPDAKPPAPDSWSADAAGRPPADAAAGPPGDAAAGPPGDAAAGRPADAAAGPPADAAADAAAGRPADAAAGRPAGPTAEPATPGRTTPSDAVPATSEMHAQPDSSG